jgi:cobalt-zinc-cadmium efflux system protein
MLSTAWNRWLASAGRNRGRRPRAPRSRRAKIISRSDAVASLLVAALMARASWCLLRDAGRILLQVAPDQVDLSAVRARLQEPDHVLDVHVVVADHSFGTGHAPVVLDRLQDCLSGGFGVRHSTFQLEPASHADHEAEAHE